MKTFGQILKENREELNLTLKDVSIDLRIDSAILSKIESGKRVATKTQADSLISFYKIPKKEAMTVWLSDKILEAIQYEEYGFDALKVAEDRVEYVVSRTKSNASKLDPEIKEMVKTIDRLHEQWISKKPLQGIQLKKLQEYFNIQYTCDSNKIEGNTLTMQETHLVVKEGLTIGGKSVAEHLEAINHYEAIEYLYDIVRDRVPLTEKLLKDLHYIILKGIDSKYAGKYRDVPVYISGSSHVPCQPYMIQKEMENVFLFYKEHKDVLHPVVLAAEMHERIVTVHPFIDGNGRTSRLIMNLILLQHGFTIANIKGDNENRLNYYKSLEDCRTNASKSMFIGLVMKDAIFSLEQHVKMVG